MSMVCAYCGRPLERLKSIESEIGEDLQEKTEYMCTNTRCHFSSRIIYESRRPQLKHGYIRVHMLQKKEPPKSWFRKFFGERVALMPPFRAVSAGSRTHRMAPEREEHREKFLCRL